MRRAGGRRTSLITWEKNSVSIVRQIPGVRNKKKLALALGDVYVIQAGSDGLRIEPWSQHALEYDLVCSGVAIMMKCEKCNCDTNVIYVTKCDGNVCDKCRIDLDKCRCDDPSDPRDKDKRSSA